ncbi:unnamed protein product [Rotaria sordida]|uniref:Lipid-binding serum glycoprotein N-terminal domain-containing protein n=1 Tax=Rotaria sordida TaxID=392033 RepID=A0A814LKK6_9BILA|nr:unnamed protein product [Rotaria sordida]CAF4166533.1 unnamed protein product [Rotaria sordida]
MLLLSILLLAASIIGQKVENTSPATYTNYQETSTDNCTGSTSICTQELPFNVNNPPDVWLDASLTVPTIELRVDNIQARLNLDTRVASLINLTAGVSVGISTVQLKIRGVNAHVQLAVKLDKIVDIVNRTLESIDLNPLLARTITVNFKIIISISNLILISTSTSKCPNNNNSVCTTLPHNISNSPDIWLNVSDLSVDEISLDIENLKAHVNVSASVANLVSLNTEC